MAETVERRVLQQTHDLLSQRTTWTYGAWARDRYNDPCHWLSEDAARWSAYGALAKFAAAWTQRQDERAALLLAMRAEARCCGIRGTMRAVNDRLGYWPVMRLIASGVSPEARIRVPGRTKLIPFWREEAWRVRALLAD
jgi:hypothetical protein